MGFPPPKVTQQRNTCSPISMIQSMAVSPGWIQRKREHELLMRSQYRQDKPAKSRS